MYYKVLLKTEGNNYFTLLLKAYNKENAKSRAKKASNGCLVSGIEECSPEEVTGIGHKAYLMA